MAKKDKKELDMKEDLVERKALEKEVIAALQKHKSLEKAIEAAADSVRQGKFLEIWKSPDGVYVTAETSSFEVLERYDYERDIKTSEIFARSKTDPSIWRKQPNEKALYVLYDTPYGDTRRTEEGTQLALHVQLWGKDKEMLAFYDTDRGHMLEGDFIEKTENGFVWERARIDHMVETWKFREVTIQEFRDRLAHYVMDGRKIAESIHTTEELWKWYRRNFPL